MAHQSGHRGGTIRRGAALLSAASLGGCGGVLDPHGPIAAGERLVILNATVIMLAIAVPTILVAVWFTWWFRATNPRAKYRPDFVYSGRVEIVMWAIPALVSLFLAGLIWSGSHELDPYKPIDSKEATLEVQVVAMDWKWLFIYPEQGVASVNELVVPAGRPIHFAMTSASVMNTFSIPQLGGMIYVMNGMVTQIHLQADHPGNFRGQSGHFSGDGFSDMGFMTRAVPPDDFTQWVQGLRNGEGAVLDRAAYEKLAEQSIPPRPFNFRMVQSDLFGAIATQEIPPAAGPKGGRGGDPRIQERAEK